MLNSNLVNILFISTAFFFIFFAYQTTASLQKIILEHERNSGFTRLGIFNFVFAATCWFVAPFVAVVGTKWALIAATVTYVIFIVYFFSPVKCLLYTVYVTLGAGSAVVYITQGNYIARNSDDGEINSVTRNSAIFLSAQQASYLISAILMYFIKYSNEDDLRDTDRYIIISVLTVSCLTGLTMLFFLRLPPSNQSIDQVEVKTCAVIFIAVKDNINLLLEIDMILLTVIFVYSGVVQAFYSGVYSSALMHTNDLNMEPTAASILGNILKGCGGFLGALTLVAISNFTKRCGRDIFMYMSGVFHLVLFLLIYLNVPDAATFNPTNEISIIDPPDGVVAMTCSFLYGLGASFYTVHIYSMLAGSYLSQSTGAFAIYKFFQCLACALSYLSSRFVSLYIQMGILIVLLIAALTCFGIVERGPRGKEKNKDGNEH